MLMLGAEIPTLLQGLARAKQAGFIDWHLPNSIFSLEEYEHYEQVENGDLNWILPGEANQSALRMLSYNGRQRHSMTMSNASLAPKYVMRLSVQKVSCKILKSCQIGVWFDTYKSDQNNTFAIAGICSFTHYSCTLQANCWPFLAPQT